MPQRIKIVILSAFYEPQMVGGAEKMVKEIAERLGERHDITMVTGLFDRKVPRLEQREQFKIVRVGIGHKKIDKILYPILSALAVRRLKPQIAHAIMESYAGLALALVKYLAPNVKRVLTLQSGDLDDDVKQSKWYINKPWRWIHTSPDIVTAISSFLAARAERLGQPRERIFITPNGLDLSKAPKGVVKEPKRVCVVSRLSWEKAHNYLLKGWVEVVKQIPDAKLYVGGDGPERENIENLIQGLNLRESVIMLGNLPHEQALIEIAKSEVFICPSLAEGLGNVFIEAQACGTPPIGTKVGGIPDVIQDGVNGLLIEPKNSEQITQSIVRLLNDKELRDKLTVNGLESSKKFDWSLVIDKFNEIYFKLLNDNY